jgi:hypothetical protein
VATLRTAASTNAFLVPPPPPQELVSKNASGQLQFTLVTPADQLSPVGSAISSESTVPFSFFYSLELPRELEQCRHAATATACF